MLTQQLVEPMSLGGKGSLVDEGAPGDTSRDSGINEPITPTGDVPAPINNPLQKDVTNNRTKVRQLDHCCEDKKCTHYFRVVLILSMVMQ